jgi:hypothetical protein
MKSREERLVQTALEIFWLEPKKEVVVPLPVRDTLYGVLKLEDGPIILTVEIDETLDVLILPENYTKSIGRVSFARMDFELNNLGNRRHFNATLEVDPKGRIWAYRSKSNVELSFATLTDDALNDANMALKHQFWLKDDDGKPNQWSQETASQFANEVVRYHSRKLALTGPETAYVGVGSPVYEFFISEKYVEALCHDYDTDLVPKLESVRFYPSDWVRNCLTLPLYEYGGVNALIEAMTGVEKRTVCNNHDYVSLQARAILKEEGDNRENAYEFLETAVMNLVGKIAMYEGFSDDPTRIEIIKSIKEWEGCSPIHPRATTRLHSNLTDLKQVVEADFAEDFQLTLGVDKWLLRISPIDVLLIRLAEIIKLFNDIDARSLGWEEA